MYDTFPLFPHLRDFPFLIYPYSRTADSHAHCQLHFVYAPIWLVLVGSVISSLNLDLVRTPHLMCAVFSHESQQVAQQLLILV